MRILTLLVLTFGLSACGPASGPIVTPPEAWRLAWSDEFDGAAGTLPNPDHWVLEMGTGPNGDGWGNNELQTYTARPENVSHDGNGNLVITARRERFANRDYTSARITTQGLYTQTYGRLEARIKVPQGKGLWPAFWTLGADIGEVSWPKCGEFDVLEVRGNQPATVVASLHGPEYFGGGSISKRYTLESGTFADDFHVFRAEWDPSRISFSVDDVVFQTVTARSVLSGGRTWVFDDPFFTLLNVAVGGAFLGPTGQPDANTVFPQSMTVDYVRWYQRETGP
jgi:beta-glucanase (GH16 family)